MSAPPLAKYIRTIIEGVASLTLGHATTLMCEPGRALVADGMSVVTKVYLRRDDSYISMMEFLVVLQRVVSINSNCLLV